MSEKIKVVHVIWSASFGGIEKVVLDIARAQEEAGVVDPVIIIGLEKGELLDKINSSGIRHYFAGFKSGRNISFKLFKRLSQLYSHADIIHIHTFNPLMAFAAILSGKRIVYTIHGNFGFGRKLSFPQKLNRSLLGIFLKRFPSHITTNSDFSKRTALRLFSLKEDSVQVVPNGVFLTHGDSLKPDSVEEDLSHRIKGKFVIGTTSRFAGFKRIDRLIDGFARFREMNPDCILLLVGDGILRGELEKQAELLGIAENVVFTGYKREIADYQNLMDVCVFPSENEPFGLVAIETLLLGKPTLVFRDGGGMAEIIEKIEPEDVVEDTAGLTRRLIAYRSGTGDSGKNGARNKFASGYDIFIMEKRLRSIYTKVALL